MRNISDKICKQNLNTHFFFNRTIYEITWKNIVEPDRSQMKIWLMQIVCWTLKARSTHSEYVIIIALPLQLWSQARTLMLRYTFIARLLIHLSALQGVSESCPSVFAQLSRSTTHTSQRHFIVGIVLFRMIQSSQKTLEIRVCKKCNALCVRYICVNL